MKTSLTRKIVASAVTQLLMVSSALAAGTTVNFINFTKSPVTFTKKRDACMADSGPASFTVPAHGHYAVPIDMSLICTTSQWLIVWNLQGNPTNVVYSLAELSGLGYVLEARAEGWHPPSIYFSATCSAAGAVRNNCFNKYLSVGAFNDNYDAAISILPTAALEAVTSN